MLYVVAPFRFLTRTLPLPTSSSPLIDAPRQITSARFLDLQ